MPAMTNADQWFPRDRSMTGKITVLRASSSTRHRARSAVTSSSPIPPDLPFDDDTPEVIHSDRLWRDVGWTAQVIKHEDDDGWAVAMTKDGEAEPALVGPWTMGRDKKNPKPLDTAAFNTLVKTAAEVLRRHEQQLHAIMHKNVVIATDDGRVRVTLDIVPDEYEPYALLTAFDAFDEQLAQVSVSPGFKLNVNSATAWIASGYAKPGR